MMASELRDFCNTCVAHLHDGRCGSKLTIGPLTFDRRGRIESGRQEAESALGVVRRSDILRCRYRLEVHEKHMASDDPYLACDAIGPTLPDVDGAIVDATRGGAAEAQQNVALCP